MQFRPSRIDASTRLCCLIGRPVKHSLSPLMHNTAFEELGLNYTYLAFEVEESSLEEAVKGLKSLGVCGFNVTIPHKIGIVEYLDEMDKSAADVGAVNTVVNRNGRLIGYNTDVQGVVFALERAGLTSPRGLSVIIGAGGAARAVVAALAAMGCREIVILNRTEERGVALAHETEKRYGIRCRVLRLTRRNLEVNLGGNLIVNATSLGMHPDIDQSPIPKELIPEGTAVFDVVYTPLKTKLLREAEERGAKTIPGIEMLIGQGASSFRLWTGKEFPVEKVRKLLIASLGGES
ncbi:MAG: shikimate dehydrogenase [Candidatus Bathyarchaeia archaeon]